MEGIDFNKKFAEFFSKTEKQIESFVTSKQGTVRDLQYIARQLFKQTDGDETKIDNALMESIWQQGHDGAAGDGD